MKTHQGLPVAPGFAMAPVKVWSLRVEQSVSFSGVDEEISRLERSLKVTAGEIEKLRLKTLDLLGEAEAQIFEAHALMLEDPEFLEGVRGLINQEQTPAAKALRQVADQFIQILQASDSPYLRERAADLQDVSQRLIRNLSESSFDLNSQEDFLLVAEDLGPSELIALAGPQLKGVILRTGGATSHTAILLKSMSVPALFGVKSLELKSLEAETKQSLWGVLDARAGQLVLNPPEELRLRSRQRLRDEEERKTRLEPWKKKETRLADGSLFPLLANVGSQKQIVEALEQGAEGIGLYRSEFLFMERAQPPRQEEQLKTYQSAVKSLAGRPLVIRTLDIGGDKEISYLKLEPEQNPFLGVRGLRLCLQKPELFLPQLAALREASRQGPVDVMFPMVTQPEELDQVFALMSEQGWDKDLPGVRWGMMLEIPGNLFQIPELAERVSFFSVGTNDLTQYLTASDRLHAGLKDLSDPFSPAVLRALAFLGAEVKKVGRELSVCGEMASDLRLAPFLVGIGVHKLSLSAALIAEMRQTLSRFARSDCEKLARHAVALKSRKEVVTLLEDFIREV